MTTTADTISQFKVCVECKQILPKTDFHKDSSTFDKLKRRYKTCRRNYIRANPDIARKATQKYREMHPEADKIIAQNYRKNHTEDCKAALQKYREDYPDRYLAYNILNNAITAGKIVRPNKCSACGEPCTPHGHHEDYSLPLVVIWLCPSCHKKLDVENQKGGA